MRLVALLMLFAGCATSEREKGTAWVRVSAPVKAEPRRFALVIGVNGFEDPRWTTLRFAERDAEGFAAGLEGFSRVTVLTGEQTRRPVILEALAALIREASNPLDTIVVYVSSHGSLAQRPGAGLERVVVSRDARMDVVLQTGLPVDELRALLDRAPAQRRLLVLALCHSGKGKSQLPDSLAAALAGQKAAPTLEQVSTATIVLTACSFGETARESDELSHDVYTHFLLEGMKLGDADGDGAITATEAHDYARTRTYAFTHGQQRPTSESEVLGVDPIVLFGARTRPAAPVVFSYSRSSEGLRVLIDGREKGTLPGSVPVDEGSHELRLVDTTSGKELTAQTMSFARGQRLNLTALLPRAPTVEIGVAGRFETPLQVVDSELPQLGGLSVRMMVRRLGWQALGLELLAGWTSGSGRAPAIERFLPTRVQALSVSGAALASVPWGAWRLDAGPTAGVSWFLREVTAPGFSANDASVGPALGARARLSWSVGWFGVGLTVDGGGVWVQRGGALQPEPWMVIAADVSWSAAR